MSSIQFFSVQSNPNSWSMATSSPVVIKNPTSSLSPIKTPTPVSNTVSSVPSARPLPEEFLPATSRQWTIASQQEYNGLSLKKRPTDISDIPEDDVQQQSLYKTELCRSFEETGVCRYGSKCQFAHGREELRPVVRHPKYKTEICKTFHSVGTCPYGKRCRFIHNSADVLNNTTSWANNWPSNDTCAIDTPTSVTPIISTDDDDEESEQVEQDEPVGQGLGRRLAIFESLCSITAEEH